MSIDLRVPAIRVGGLVSTMCARCRRYIDGDGLLVEIFSDRLFLHPSCTSDMHSERDATEASAALVGGGIGFMLGALLGPKLGEMGREALSRPPCACTEPKRMDLLGIAFCGRCRGLIEEKPKEAT